MLYLHLDIYARTLVGYIYRHLTIHFRLAKEDRRKGIHGYTSFSAIFVICKILDDKTLLQTLMTNISALIEAYDHVNITQVGFPYNWKSILETIK